VLPLSNRTAIAQAVSPWLLAAGPPGSFPDVRSMMEQDQFLSSSSSYQHFTIAPYTYAISQITQHIITFSVFKLGPLLLIMLSLVTESGSQLSFRYGTIYNRDMIMYLHPVTLLRCYSVMAVLLGPLIHTYTRCYFLVYTNTLRLFANNFRSF
jgi:hypothetical protein